MPKLKSAPTKAAKRPAVVPDVQTVVRTLERHGTKRTRDGMARYGIVAPKAFGVSMASIQSIAKRIGKSHDLADALWDTGWYEARLLACLVAEPERVTAGQMDRWCRDFDNWAICDTACFHLFDRTPHAFRKVMSWAKRRDEFVRRAAFALLASLALHDKRSESEAFSRCISVIEDAADDERNFVKKAVNWALRAIGGRNVELHATAVDVARRLSTSPDSTARWIGKDALRQLTRPAVIARLKARAARKTDR